MIDFLDMASSPQYLAPSALTPEHIEVDSNTTALPDGSGSIPTTVAYSHPDQGPYAELSPFGTSSIDDNVLTPVSSASSPPLQPKFKSAYDSEAESLHYSQQPTPPHHAAMYSPYPDYLHHHTTQATSSMSMQASAAETPEHFFINSSPGPEDSIPPPQSKLYLGAFSASNVSVAPETDAYPGYLHNPGMDSQMSLLRASNLSDVNAGSYTHRPLGPMSQGPPMASLLPHSPQDLEHYRQLSLPRLSPGLHSTVRQPHANKRDPSRKPLARRRRPSPPHLQAMYPLAEAPALVMAADDGPVENVTLDDKTPQDLVRLWEIRKKHRSQKGNGMWESITAEFFRDEPLGSDTKKQQLKAQLQMKIHRMLLKHGVWPERDQEALLRAYRRWEENRYNEILRLLNEEMDGSQKAFDWKSPHVEAQLVKMGLEEPQLNRDSKARKRKQVRVRHQQRASNGGTAAAARQQRQQTANAAAAQVAQAAAAAAGIYNNQQGPQRLHAYHEPHHQYTYAPGHYRAPSYDEAEELVVESPDLDDAQREQLVDQAINRAPHELTEQDDDDNNNHHHPHPGLYEDLDPRMSNPYAGHIHPHPHEQHHLPPLHEQQQQHHHHGLPLPSSHWETVTSSPRPRNTSTPLLHPALIGESGSSHANSPAAGMYGPPAPGTPGSVPPPGSSPHDFGAQQQQQQRSTPQLARSKVYVA